MRPRRLFASASGAGVKYRVPEGIDQMCCGTPWKSKGYTDGYSIMSDRVLKALWQATDGGRIPIVCDASSCTEGLEVMRAKVAAALEHKITQGLGAGEADYAQLKLIDSVQFAADTLLPSSRCRFPCRRWRCTPPAPMLIWGVQPAFEKMQTP